LENVGVAGAAGVIRFVDLCAGLGGFHRGLSATAETVAKRYGLNISFECVAAAELEDDLRRAYVSNFPEISGAYRKLYGDLKGIDTKTGLPQDPLRSSLPSFDSEGRLLKIHGDMTCFLNDAQTGLRERRDGRPFLPSHDLLCAGFPCQPFSKSGAQLGFEDTRGTVFHSIATILREHRPAFLLLENVGNFPKHDGGNTWSRVKNILEEELGYQIVATDHVGNRATGGLLSPHHLGYPHHRERFFVVGQRKVARRGDSALVKMLLHKPLDHVKIFPSARQDGALSPAASRILDARAKKSLVAIISKTKAPTEIANLVASQISPDRARCINHWGELLKKFKELDRVSSSSLWQDSMPSFPVWGFELDPWQWYPTENNPAHYTFATEYLSAQRKRLFSNARAAILKTTNQKVDLKQYPPTGERSWLSKNFTVSRIEDWIDSWPGYAGKREEWPHWKQRFILQNREWAIKLWSALDPAWLREWLDTLYNEIRVASFQKLEWNCKGEDLDIWAHILRFRPSGLRVKRLAHVPALVAMTTTQIPIVPRMNPDESTTGSMPGARGRHLIPSEALQLQGFPAEWHLPFTRERAFTCFGNAVHVGVVHDVVLNWIFGHAAPVDASAIASRPPRETMAAPGTGASGWPSGRNGIEAAPDDLARATRA